MLRSVLRALFIPLDNYEMKYLLPRLAAHRRGIFISRYVVTQEINAVTVKLFAKFEVRSWKKKKLKKEIFIEKKMLMSRERHVYTNSDGNTTVIFFYVRMETY